MAASIGVVALLGPERRRHYQTWTAWALSAPIAVLSARAAGLVHSTWYPVLLTWGAVTLVGVLVWDDVAAGRRTEAEWLRARWRRAPFVLGATGLALGQALIYRWTGPTTYGWWGLVVAVMVAVVAWQLHLGVLSVASYGLATVGYVALAPWEPLRHPWSLLPFAAALSGIAFGFERFGSVAARARWRRWDLPPLTVAHAAAAVGLIAAPDAGSVPATFLAAGMLSTGLAIWRRHPAWLGAGTVLALIGAHAAGPGWGSLAVAAIGLAATVGARFAPHRARTLLQLTGVASFVATAAELSRVR